MLFSFLCKGNLFYEFYTPNHDKSAVSSIHQSLSELFKNALNSTFSEIAVSIIQLSKISEEECYEKL